VSLPVGEQFKAHEPGMLRAAYGLTWSDTDHYYIGTERDEATETNVAPATLGVDHLLGIEYDLPARMTAVAEVPFTHTEQSREFGGVAGTMAANGLGDVRLLARYWLSSGAESAPWYASIGARLPTGKSDEKFRARNGRVVTQDLAAQAGTGNFAGIVELGGSRTIGRRLGLGLSARYIFTPEATTVANFRHELTGTGPARNSDADALTTRLGLVTPLSTGAGAWSAVTLGVLADFAWIPKHDLFGETEGFRRAGPMLFVGPTASWSPLPALSLGAAVPITVYRDMQENGGNVQEWTLQFSLSYRRLLGRGGA